MQKKTVSILLLTLLVVAMFALRLNVQPAHAQYIIPVTIDIDPDTLNLGSEGQCIIAVIDSGEVADVEQVDLQGGIWMNTIPAALAPTEIGDFDNDSIPELMVKFDRGAVSAYILSKGITSGFVTMEITGALYDGTPFRGEGTIRVLTGGDGTGSRE